MLKQVGLNFIAVDPGVEESSTHPDPRRRVMENALYKAECVAKKGEDTVVIAADTVVYIDGVIMGKPGSEAEAVDMLRKLSDNVHKVFTGVAVIHPIVGSFVDFEETLVHIRRLSDGEILKYVESGEPMDKAGAYAIQGYGAVFVDRVVGCFHNVIGLPLALLNNMFHKAGIDMMDKVL